jgi:hypothetical protein
MRNDNWSSSRDMSLTRIVTFYTSGTQNLTPTQFRHIKVKSRHNKLGSEMTALAQYSVNAALQALATYTW